MVLLNLQLRNYLKQGHYSRMIDTINSFPIDEVVLSPYLYKQCQFIEKDLVRRLKLEKQKNCDKLDEFNCGVKLDDGNRALSSLRGLLGSSLSPSLFHLLYITQYNPHLFISLAMTSLDEYLRIWDDMVSIHIPPPVYLLQYFLSYTNSGPQNVSGDHSPGSKNGRMCRLFRDHACTIFSQLWPFLLLRVPL